MHFSLHFSFISSFCTSWLAPKCIWGFPKIPLNQIIPFIDGISPYKPSSYGGTPMAMEAPICLEVKRYEDDGAEFLRAVLDGLRDKKSRREPCGSATDTWSVFFGVYRYIWVCVSYTIRTHTHTYIHACMHCITLHYITLHCITLHYTTLHYTILHYITLHYTTLHYTTLHYITLHYTTLHCITLHYITYIHTCAHTHTETWAIVSQFTYDVLCPGRTGCGQGSDVRRHEATQRKIRVCCGGVNLSCWKSGDTCRVQKTGMQIPMVCDNMFRS